MAFNSQEIIQKERAEFEQLLNFVTGEQGHPGRLRRSPDQNLRRSPHQPGNHQERTARHALWPHGRGESGARAGLVLLAARWVQ
jgi:hypothetical protein